MLRYFISALLLMPFASFAQDGDTTAVVNNKKADQHQLRFGLELSNFVINSLQKEHSAYEVQVDYYWKNELYLDVEAGFGTATFNEDYLKYNSSNAFLRVGFDKSMLSRTMPSDWDMVFIGLRYGVALINRQDARYVIIDSTWGNSSGTTAGTSLSAHWAEITGGVRVAVYKNLFLGWNVRAKFLINGKTFEELPPSYIAGYGKGDKKTIFDYNFYISYALRWAKKKADLKTSPKE